MQTCRIPLNCILEVRYTYSSLTVVFSSPSMIVVNMEESFITKDVFYDCIPIHGNTIFTSFSISPDLPQDLNIDTERSCIGGVYTGNFYGSQRYFIEGWNYMGKTNAWFTLYFSRNLVSMLLRIAMLHQGLNAKFYEVHPNYESLFRYLPSYPEDALTERKRSRLVSLNMTSTDMESPFFSYGVMSIRTMYSVLSGYLFVKDPGYYSFRIAYESDDDKVNIMRFAHK